MDPDKIHEQLSSLVHFYRFHGVVHPERAQVHFFQFPELIAYLIELDLTFGMTLTGDYGRFEIVLRSNKLVSDLATLRNAVKRLLDFRVNAISFYNGCYYNAEIVYCTLPNGQFHTFGVELSALKFDSAVVPFVNLVGTPCFIYLSRAIDDFSRAKQHVSDAAFYSYRAIESIRQFYSSDKEDRKKEWLDLRNDLNLQASDFDFVLPLAGLTRHGKDVSLSEEDALRCLQFAWEVIQRFVVKRLAQYFPK